MLYLKKDFPMMAIIFVILTPFLTLAQNDEDQNVQSSREKNRTTTISDYEYIRSEISKLSGFSMEFDELKEFFSSNPTYSIKCYTDAEVKKSSYVNLGQKVFGPFFPPIIEGEISFELQQLDLGFNLFQTTHMNFLTDPYQELVTCSRSNGGCKSFSKNKSDEEFPYLPESEEYIARNAVKSESWITYIAEDKKTLFAEVSISAETQYRGYILDEGSSFYFNQDYLCVAKPQSKKKMSYLK